MKALEKDPANRYHTALEMAQALKIALQFPEKEITLDTPVITIEPAKRQPPAHLRRRSQERAWVVAAAAFLLLALSVGSFLIVRSVITSTRAPYLMYYTEQEAVREAEKAGLRPQIVRQSSAEPAGTVILQSHDFDYPMRRGDTILITVSTGPVKQTVPQLVGSLTQEAEQALERIGIKMLQTDRLLNVAAPGTILSQSPAPGTEVEYGAIVQVVVSGGEVTIPRLEGEVYADWLLRLQNLGLIVNKISEVVMEDPLQAGRVAAQSPKAGEKVMTGTTLELAVYVLSQPSPTP